MLIFYSGSQKRAEQAEITKECSNEYRPALKSQPAILLLWEPKKLLRVGYFVLRYFNSVVTALAPLTDLHIQTTHFKNV